MKKICFNLLAGYILSLFFTSNLFATDFKKADELFEKGTFQAALAEYDQIVSQSKNSHEAFKAFYRGCESLSHLYRYGEAVERIRQYKGNPEGHDRHRLLTLKAEILRNFLLQYGGYQRSDVIDVPGKEVFRLTPKEIKQEISDSYAQLFDSREELVKFPLQDEAYFLDLEKIDFGKYPTFLDYAVESWLGHLRQYVYDQNPENKAPNPEATALLADDFTQPLQFNDPSGLLAAELIETLVRLHGEQNIEARERWKIVRLLLPVGQNFLYTFPKDKNYFDYALQAKDVLMRWAQDFKNPEAKAEALYQAANLFYFQLYNKVEQREKRPMIYACVSRTNSLNPKQSRVLRNCVSRSNCRY